MEDPVNPNENNQEMAQEFILDIEDSGYIFDTSSVIISLLIYKQSCHTHARADAHARQKDLLPRPATLAEARDNLPRTGGTKRVPQGNRATLGVHLGPVQAQLVTAVDGHGREGLVDLDDVAVVQRQVVLCQELGNSNAGADAHDAGGQASNRRANVLGDDGLAQLDGCGALHQEHGGG